MIELTAEQREFLFRHRISASELFDASGLRAGDWQPLAKEEGKGFAIGAAPCRKAAHTLRTRKGHCIQCSPSNISYFRRYAQTGFVYIAVSAKGKLLKIGMSTDLAERETQLNIYRYGGCDGWAIVRRCWTANAGSVEFEAHKLLKPYSKSGSYSKAVKQYSCYELFSCKLNVAIEAVEHSLPKGKALI